MITRSANHNNPSLPHLPVFFLQETPDGSRFWGDRLQPGNKLLEVTRRIPYQRQPDERPKRVQDWL